jgi:ubiquinone/menaquinone biosynthesis C-methylase UbiE
VAAQPDQPPEVGDSAEFVASAWERHREQLFENQRPVSEWLVDHVDPRPGQTILELAAGPGDTGFLAAERVGADGRLISTDLSAGMIDAARRGAEARGLGNVELRVMDAQQIDLPDESVDGVISRFAVMLMPDAGAALRGAKRVLRDGGRLAYAVWGPPDRNPWLTALVGAVLQTGHALPGDPFGPGGVFSLAEPDANRALLEGAGFSDVRIEEIPGAMRYDDFDHYWRVQSSVSGPFAILVQSLPAGDVDAIKGVLEPSVEQFSAEDGLRIPSLAIGISAR